MELHVELNQQRELNAIVDCLDEPGMHLLEMLQLWPVLPQRRLFGTERLDRSAYLHQLGDLTVVSGEPSPHLSLALVSQVAGHEAATTADHLDESDGLQRTECLADAHATHAKPFDQVTFGRQTLPRLENAVADRLFELLAHELHTLAVVDARECGLRRRSSGLGHSSARGRLRGRTE